MPHAPVCRLCLATDVRLVAIANTALQDIYEKLTNVALNSMEKPIAACYLCVAQLKKCQKFAKHVIEADELLTWMLQTGAKITPDSIAMVDRKVHKLSANLTMAPTVCNGLEFCQPLLEVKKEMSCEMEEIICAKEEVYSEGEGNPPAMKPELINTEFENIVIENEHSICDQNIVYANQNLRKQKYNHKIEKPFTENMNSQTIEAKKAVEGYYYGQEDLNEAFICNDCGIKFYDKSILVDHIENHNAVKAKMYFNCDLCPYRGLTRDYLEKHVLIHNNGTRINLSVVSREPGICQYKNSHNKKLKSFVRIQKEVKTYQCTVCDYRSNQKSNLTQHLHIHAEEKRYECSVCNYKCSRKSNLTRHLRHHTGDKPYECTICEYKCTVKAHLTAHVRTHTGEKPYECLECTYTSNQKGNLTRHLRLHTGEKPYGCTVCEYRSRDRTSLKIHLRTHLQRRR